MDNASPENSALGINEKDGVFPVNKMDSNAYSNIEEFELGGLKCDAEGPSNEMASNAYSKVEECGPGLKRDAERSNSEMQVYTNDGYASSTIPSCGVIGEGTQSPVMESHLLELSLPVTRSVDTTEVVEPRLPTNGADSKTSCCETDKDGSPIKDYKKQDLLDADAGATLTNVHGSLDQGDNDHNDREHNGRNSGRSPPGEAENGEIGKVSIYSRREDIETDERTDDENLNKEPTRQNEIQAGMIPLENTGMVWENSSLQSPLETQNVSPPLERRLSVSAERSPQIQAPPKGHTSPGPELQSPANQTLKSAPSPNSSRIRQSTSPDKYGSSRKRTNSRDHASPSAKRRSPSERASKREAHNRDDSPRRRLSRSPRKHDSPRRRGRSASKSPVRRRDSPGSQRARRHPRSRSPIARDRHRKSPRRHSPRRRSPYHSRRHSPRRPWSPPPNRNTGIGRPGKNLFVAGFSYVTTERDLERKFSKFGRVTDVRIVRDRRSGDSRGFGFLSLDRDEDADEAIRAMDQTEWNGRIVLVEKSKTSTR
ncbi:Glycine-rich RNA-binding protein 8 [Apostasia shenzhenica]|uniref:Glycine-rich RNA-binding protein 8 n=1 Tax=Apostasia shenzhenica TaxID=1088818 RepID=A0A2I0AAL9_9ASPA|nr:Glycine-rich RNA-binding protein 8 [Apostasia shenzhenica]